MPFESRRGYLRAAGTALVLGVAGCTSGADTTPSQSESETPIPTSTERSPSPTDTGSPSPTPSRISDLEGAWSQPGADAGTTHFAPGATGPTSEPTTVWTVELDATPLGLAVVEGRAFVGTTGGLVVLEATTGERLWSIETEVRVRGPAVVDGVAYLGVGEYARAVAVEDGSEVWSDLETQFESVVGDTLFGFGPEGALVAYDIADASGRWSFGQNESLKGPAIAGGQVYLRVGEREELVALDAADGSEIWRVEPPGAHPAALTATAGRFYQGSYYGTLFAHDAGDGTLAWNAGAYDGVFGSIGVGPETVYPVTYNGGSRLVALASGDGTERWRVERPALSAPAITAETVFAVGGEHLQDGPASLFAIDASDGSTRWSLSPAEWVPHTPVVVDDVCFVADIGSRTVRALV